MTKISVEKGKDPRVVYVTLENESIKVVCTNIGCRMLSIETPDRKGENADILLGLRDVEADYENDTVYMCGVVGRVANRIAGAAFDLNGITYHLPANNGKNTNHGGDVGFDKRIFDTKVDGEKVVFSYLSPEGEEGFPGNLLVKVTLELQWDSLLIGYEAESDADTLVNLCSHMYFNLSGGAAADICGHRMEVKADQISCLDERMIPTGEMLPVAGTAFDFRKMRTIGVPDSFEDSQIKVAAGYDHDFLLYGDKEQVKVYDAASGRMLTISTDMPYARIYTGNFLHTGTPGKTGEVYPRFAGVAVEPGYLADSIHQEMDSPTILRKGEKFTSKTRYAFSCE